MSMITSLSNMTSMVTDVKSQLAGLDQKVEDTLGKVKIPEDLISQIEKITVITGELFSL